MDESVPMAQLDGRDDGHPPAAVDGSGDALLRNIRLRADMSAIKPVPVPIVSDRLIKTHQQQWSPNHLDRFCPSNRMPRFYARIGFLAGRFPMVFFILGIILCAAFGAGLKSAVLKDNVRDGYTPTTSRARQESNVLRAFLNSTDDPTSTIVLIRARDGGSMHRLRHLEHAWQISEFLRSNLTARCLPGAEKEHCTFMDFCGSFCYSNIFLRTFLWALEEQVKNYRAQKELSASTNLTFPRGKSDGFTYQLEGNFFGVITRPLNDTRPTPKGIVPISNCSCESPELTEVKAVSYVDFVELVMVVFRGDFLNPDDQTRMKNWEMAVYDFIRHELNDSLVEVLVLGNEIVDYEMKEDGRGMAPYFAAGMALTIIFVVGSVVADSLVSDVMDGGKLIMAFFVILCPTMALVTTFGGFGWLGWRINSVSMITPFLIMGIGVNDAFLILHAWHQTPVRSISIAQRMGIIMEEAGPSITITTVTDVTTFILGSLTPTEEISIFCYVTAVALTWCYIFTILVFLPAMVYCTKLENEHGPYDENLHKHHKESRLARIYNQVSVLYCKWIMHPATGIVVIVLCILSLSAAVIGFIRIDSRLDTEKILPHDSPIREPHKLIAHKVWTDYYPVTIFVNMPVDLDTPAQLKRVENMTAEFEAMTKCRGSEFTHIWIRDYAEFKKESASFDDFLGIEDFDFDTEKTTTLKPKVEGKPYYRKLRKFLNSLYYQHYKSFLKVDYDEEVPVRSFWFTVLYHNTTNWDEKIALMQDLRAVADRFTDMGVSVWEVNGMFVDQMLSLKSLTYYNGIITIVCMAVISIFFISHTFLICLAVLSITSIALEVIGFLSWWGLDLDPVTLCAFLMSVGMSVDFTAHIAYHLKLQDITRVHHGELFRYELQTKQHKVIATLEAVGWPTAQAGVSTVVCVLPLILLQNYIPLVFVKTISLVVIFGLLHGLLIMPAVYALSWQCWDYLKKVLGCDQRASEDFAEANGAKLANGLNESLLDPQKAAAKTELN